MKPLVHRGLIGRIWATLVALAATLVFQPTALSQELSYPLYIGTSRTILDEFGRRVQGAAVLPPEACDRVEVLATSDGGIYPPSKWGTPDPRNVVITGGVSHIGNLTALGLTNSGIFSIVLATNQPVYNARLFVRVFNAPSRSTASFYADSEVFTNQGTHILYDVQLSAMIPLDPDDDDFDGLNNSWEKSYGTDPLRGDTDGDGMGDWQEVRAGTDPLDADSLFIMAWVRAGEEHSAVVAWDSIPGRLYQVEYTPDDLRDNPVYQNVSAVLTASSSVTEATVPNGLLSNEGHFRIRLVEE